MSNIKQWFGYKVVKKAYINTTYDSLIVSNCTVLNKWTCKEIYITNCDNVCNWKLEEMRKDNMIYFRSNQENCLIL